MRDTPSTNNHCTHARTVTRARASVRTQTTTCPIAPALIPPAVKSAIMLEHWVTIANLDDAGNFLNSHADVLCTPFAIALLTLWLRAEPDRAHDLLWRRDWLIARFSCRADEGKR